MRDDNRWLIDFFAFLSRCTTCATTKSYAVLSSFTRDVCFVSKDFNALPNGIYKYFPLNAIATSVSPLRSTNDFRLSWKTAQKREKVVEQLFMENEKKREGFKIQTCTTRSPMGTEQMFQVSLRGFKPQAYKS